MPGLERHGEEARHSVFKTWQGRAFRVCKRFASESEGQDLLEYALLAAFIGIAGWAVLMTIPDTIAATYASWIDPNVGVPALWDPPDPAAAGS